MITEYSKQKINGILPDQNPRGKHNKGHSYKIFLRQELIDDSFHGGTTCQLKIPESDYDRLQNPEQNEDQMDEQESEDEIEAIDFKKLIVFNHQGTFIQVWNCIDIFCCLMSGYVYAWIGCFGIKEDV